MTVYALLEMCNDTSNIRIRIFDYNSEEIIFDSDNLEQDEEPVMEIYFSDMGDYDVSSYDLYLHNGVINLELNIDYNADEEEYEDD